ncbi:MAG: NBR1-Ig-like domain-containing protein [Anaerolineae bacterium]|nr:NBR1-Ig-like domain-containing protein [Anaerolineae bacterium]
MLIYTTILGLLSACGGQAASIPDNPFVAPTTEPIVLPSATPEPSTPSSPSSTEESDCTNALQYVDDLTIPDGSQYAPGAEVEKVWLVRNAGSCDWENGYTLRLVSGPNLGAGDQVALFPARSGSEVEIRILFTAPGAPGDYVSEWQAFDPSGEPFGDVIFIDIEVSLALAPPASATPAATGTE